MSELDLAFGKAIDAVSETKSNQKSLVTFKQRWEKLRAQYADKSKTIEDLDIKLSVRYGKREWASRSELKKLEQLREQRRKIEQKMMGVLDEVSPRDWHHGVPSHWVYSKLSWEDAVRPLNEKLSVVPPLSYGATSPKE